MTADVSEGVSSIQLFRARGAMIGGVYPFRLGKHTPNDKKIPDLFKREFEHRDEFLDHKRRMYGPEHRWTNPASLLFYETRLTCCLTSGRTISDAKFEAYVSLYPVGFGTIIFWVDLSNDEFRLEELIELTALVSGMPERIIRRKQSAIDVILEGNRKPVNCFLDICDWLEDKLRKTLPRRSRIQSSAVKFVYPIVFVNEVPDCQTATEIVSKYSVAVAGLLNLWDLNWDLLKDQEVHRMIETDFHPLDYGLACLSSVCTAELHPTNIRDVIKRKNIEPTQQYFTERTWLALMFEPTIGEIFVMRTYYSELVRARAHSTRIGNPVEILILPLRAILLAKTSGEIARSLNLFRTFYFTRRSYVPRAMAMLREALGGDRLEKHVDTMLSELRNDLSTACSILISSSLVVLTAAVVGLTLKLVWLK